MCIRDSALYTRGRHNSISTITATQKFAAIAPIIRVHATELYVYRFHYKDLETFVEEVSAITDKATILQIYQMATAEPLYVNLRAKSKNHIFHIRFEKRIEIYD